FIFRMREFEQMEMQFFVKPGTQKEWYEKWKAARMEWHRRLGHPTEKLRYHDHDNLAHYADAAVDIQFDFPFGFKELEGIHSRTDFDLSSHQELSGKKLQYFDPQTKESYVPYVVETSIGADRMFLATMSNALVNEQVPGQDDPKNTRDVLKLHPAIAPIKAAIMPLKRNDERLVNAAQDIFNALRFDCKVMYDDTGSIGKLYRRQDATGTPFCVTVDFETLDDNCVTIRDRDNLTQERVKIEDLNKIIGDKVNMKALLQPKMEPALS
ncbi:MAG: glycine--tRNA ligase, partial [Bacteroidota bacterium]